MTAWLRRLAESASHGRIVRRRLPDDLGGHELLVTPEASLRYWRRDLGRVERPLLDLAREFVSPGMVVWDIGANVGVFSLASAYRSGPSGWVGAVEPQSWLANLIRRSAAGAPPTHSRVEVLAAAVASRSGAAAFAVAKRGLAASHLAEVEGSSQTGGTRSVVSVPTVRLDDLVADWPSPQLLKIDVEGAEVLCLQGAGKLLSQGATVLCEVTAENAAAVAAVLRNAGYTMFDASEARDRRAPLDLPVWSTLALPQ